MRVASSNTHRWFGAYGPSKAALDHLLMVAADELGPSWVEVDHRAGMLESIFGADGLRGVV